MYVLSRVTALTGLYLQSALIRLLKHLSIRLGREKEVLRQHEKADLCWPVSLLFHSMKFPDKCFHGKFRLAEFSSLQHAGFPDSLTEGISYRALWFCSADRQGKRD